MITDSILTSIKKLSGITEEYEHFDLDMIMYINTALAMLTQIGVGPTEGFTIKNSYTTWSDFIQNDKTLEPVKTYVSLKVRLLFDTPLNSTVIDSMNKMLSELEYRILVASEAS